MLFTSYMDAVRYLKSVDKLWLISDEMTCSEVIDFANLCFKKINELTKGDTS